MLHLQMKEIGVCVVGAFKLDYQQHVKQIFDLSISKYLDIYTGGGSHFLLVLAPRPTAERKRGSSLSLNGKWYLLNETQGFLTLGHSNWAICSLLSWFCSKNFQYSWPLYGVLPLLVTPERGSEEAAGDCLSEGLREPWSRSKKGEHDYVSWLWPGKDEFTQPRANMRIQGSAGFES